jgi:glycosyltransferase involved in cell wall biosynthesis
LKKKQKIIVSVTNDLVVDQRVHKVCTFLHENNFDLVLVGRKLKSSAEISRNYKTKRFRLLFNKGPLFYANYNFRLFFYLLFHKADVLLSNDLDTLLPNYLVSKIKKQKLVYDTHEYFTEVPELIDRPFVKKVWESIESFIFPKLKYVYTVNESLAKVFHEKYNVSVKSVKNVPLYRENKFVTKNTINTVIYQGALNKDRGIEELIEAFQFLENTKLQIVGSGDLDVLLKRLVSKLNLGEKIEFLGKIPFEDLREHTLKAHLGVSLEKATNLNYHFALPNKLFDYISCNLPVLTCDLPEIKNVVENYKIGELISEVSAKNIADKIQNLLENKEQMKIYIENSKIAAKELCWENEIKVLEKIYL